LIANTVATSIGMEGVQRLGKNAQNVTSVITLLKYAKLRRRDRMKEIYRRKKFGG